MTTRTNETIEKVKVLGRSLGWTSVELQHAIESMADCQLANEITIKLVGGKELHAPAYPAKCEYVRIMQNGYELAYWSADEFKDCPEDVLGALIGAMYNRNM